jgi:hypothetical protein
VIEAQDGSGSVVKIITTGVLPKSVIVCGLSPAALLLFSNWDSVVLHCGNLCRLYRVNPLLGLDSVCVGLE